MLRIASLLVPIAVLAFFPSDTGAQPLVVQPQTKVSTPIALSSWDLSAPQVAPFSQIRVSSLPTEIDLRPNEADPANSFGWISAPLQAIPAPLWKPGRNLVGLTVNYVGPTFTGTAPTIRLRLHNEDFSLYSESGVTSAQFALHPGPQTITALFDGNSLAAATNMRLYIDLVSVLPGQTVDPNFTVAITGTEFFTNYANTLESDDMVKIAWIQKDFDAYCIHGPAWTRVRLRGTVNDIAFNEYIVAVIDSGDLYAYDVRNNFTEVTVEDDFTDNNDLTKKVLQASVVGDYVIWLEADKDAFYQNMLTGASKKFDTNVHSIGAGTDGAMIYFKGTDGALTMRRIDIPTDDTLQIESSNDFLLDGGRKTTPPTPVPTPTPTATPGAGQ